MEYIYKIPREAWPQDLTSYSLATPPRGIWFRQNAKSRPVGLHWIFAELGRHHGPDFEKKTAHLDNPLGKAGKHQGYGIGQELPALIAMHPGWVQKVSRGDTPGLFAPDIELNYYKERTCLAFGRMKGKEGGDKTDIHRLLNPPKVYPIGLRRGPNELAGDDMGTGYIVYHGDR